MEFIKLPYRKKYSNIWESLDKEMRHRMTDVGAATQSGTGCTSE
jgi:hypothetical protein